MPNTGFHSLPAWSSKFKHFPSDQRQSLLCRSKPLGNALDVAPSQGHVGSSALENDFYSLEAELDELGAALHRPQHSSTAHTQFDTCMQQQQGDFTSMQQQGIPPSMQQGFPTSSIIQPHAMFQVQPVSSGQRWASATEAQSDLCNESLQHAQHAQQKGTAHAHRASDDNVHEFAAGMYQQQGRHSQSDRTAQDAQLHSSCQYDHTTRAGVGLGSKRHSRGGHFPSPGSILGCSSVRSLPVLNNSFIVPAQAMKPKKVDRVTRHRSKTTACLAEFEWTNPTCILMLVFTGFPDKQKIQYLLLLCLTSLHLLGHLRISRFGSGNSQSVHEWIAWLLVSVN